MGIRKIRTFDDPILRKNCKKVTEINNNIRTILDDMLETLHSTPNGAALAAPQIGILKRLVVIDFGEEQMKLINPSVVLSEGEQFEVEGCLSFPDSWGKVHRPKKVIVEALNEKGEKITIEGVDFMAKCLCHEIDHLNGIVFIDKVEEWTKI